VLVGHQDHSEKKWTEDVLAAIDEALDKAGKLTPRQVEPKDVLPHWGKGVQDDGSVTLAMYMRFWHQGRGIGQGAIDAVTFSEKDWKEFTPPEPKAGKTWDIPVKLGKEFCRCLSVVSDKGTMPTPDEVTEVDFSGTVTRVKGGLASLTYTGKIAALHTHPFNKNYVNTVQATLRGIGTYDVEKKEMVSLLWILDGAARNVKPPEKGDRPLASVVEWQRDAKLEKAPKR
jgi:hypothetical protein